MKTLFEFNDHWTYVREMLSSKASARGLKSKLAGALGVRPAYISQVLSEKLALTVEQADRTSEFFLHSPLETEFFYFLVSRDRAGTESLRKNLSRQIDRIKSEKMDFSKNVSPKNSLAEEYKTVFYSDWRNPLIYSALTIPRLRKPAALAKELGLNIRDVVKTLATLESLTLIEKSREDYLPKENWLRIDRQSPQIHLWHQSCRLLSVTKKADYEKGDARFSAIYSLNQESADQIRKFLAEAMQKSAQQVEKAKPETLYFLSIDFLQLG